MELKFRSDTVHRKQYFTGMSFSHPAKMMLPLQIWLIENYTQPGETILDCMAGSGTVLVACMMGRHVITCELEQKFVEMQKGNWEKLKQRGPMMGYEMGEATILQGDARNLEGILADKIITSPPYENQIHRNSDEGKEDEIKAIDPQHYCENSQPVAAARYSPVADNIGNLKSESYLAAMLQVYQQCFKVLRPAGLMCLVLKNFIRDRKIIKLDLDTIRLCEQCGFTFKERHYRKLTSQSFWRTIYQKKYPDAPVLNKEDIIVFIK